MAERVALQIDVEAGKSVKTLGQIEKEISGINREMNELTQINNEFKQELIAVEARFKKIPKTALSARKKIGTQLEGLKAAIKDNNLALENFRLKKKQVGDMKRDLKMTSKHFLHSSGSVLQFGASLGEAAAGFMLLSGVSEENTKKIEKAIGVMFAFEGVAGSIRHGLKLWNEDLKATAIGQKIVTAGQWMWTTAVGATSGALKFLRLALIATGIGAIVVGVIALVMNFSKLVKWVKNITNGMGAFGKVIKTTIKIALAPLLLTIALVKKGLQALGIIESDEEKAKKSRASAERKRQADKRELIKQEIEQARKLIAINKEQSDKRIAQLNHEIAVQKALGKEVSKLIENRRAQEEKAALEHSNEVALVQLKEIALLKETRADLQKAYEQHKNMGHAFGDEMAEIFKGHVDTTTQQIQAAAKVAGDAHDELVAVRRKNELEVIAEDKADDDREKAKADKRKERRKTEQQALFDLEVAKKQADAEDILDERKKAEALIEIERFKHEKELLNKKLTDGEKELLEFEYQQRIADIAQQFADMELEREQAEDERKEEKRQKELDDWAEFNQLLADDKKISDDKILEEEERVQDAKLELATTGLNALMSLNDAFVGSTLGQQKKAFERNKKLQIAQAILSAQQGVVNILANASLIPDPFGTIYKVGMIGALGATLVSQIAKINQTQFTGGSGGGGGGISASIPGGGAAAPQIAPVTNTSTLVPQEPQKVYVTETDISDTQNKVSVIEAQATIK